MFTCLILSNGQLIISILSIYNLKMEKLTPELLLKKRQSIMKEQYFEQQQGKPTGNYVLLVNHYHKGQPLLTLGPNFLFFFSIFLMYNGLNLLLLLKMQQYEQLQPFYMIKIVSLIFIDVIWLSTALINPGIAPKISEEQGKICYECQGQSKIYVGLALQRHHCKICQICIDQHLFHSRLIGGCVGKNNYSVFKILLFAIFVESLCFITIVPILGQIN